MQLQKISPCLWFDTQAEEAARYYCAIFPDAQILGISHYGDEGRERHGKPAGSILAVVFELAGQTFTALNSGPSFIFNETISLQLSCYDQGELDYYWARLSEGGVEQAQQGGWLRDKFGVAWQLVPSMLPEMMCAADPVRSERVMAALLKMKKLDIALLQQAYEG